MTKIKVVGIGGSGGNTVSRIAKFKTGIDLVAINTDIQDLSRTEAKIKIQIGKKLTGGLGSGMDPEIGRKAAEEQKEEIKEVLAGSDLVFIAGGEGGGTFTGAAPVIARILKELRILTVAVTTEPFSFEGESRMKIAQKGILNLKDKVGSILVISNDKLIQIIPPSLSVSNAFFVCDEVLRQAVLGISNLISFPGIVNVDFADIKSLLQDSGQVFFGIGRAQGENRITEAANSALNSPLVDISPKGAREILFNISGTDISLEEVNQAASILTKEINPGAKIIFGTVKDPQLRKGEVKIIFIAAKF